MSLVKSAQNVKRIEVADLGHLGYCVVKNDDAMMQRNYVGQPTDRMTAIAAAVKLSAGIGWALNVKL